MNDKQKEYREYFKDPRWQKLRLKILERDNFSCQRCFDDKSTLNVHHKYYEHGKKPWEYPIEALTTLCQNCHEMETIELRASCERLERAFRIKFFSNEIDYIASIFEKKIHITLDFIPIILKYWLLNKKNAKYLEDKYFSNVSKKYKGKSTA